MTFISIRIIASQNSYHDDKSAWQYFTRVFFSQMIRNLRSRRRIDSSSIIAHPVTFDIQWERSLKYDHKNSTYNYIYTYISPSRYGFSISVEPEITPLFIVSFQWFSTVFKSWQVCDWLPKWLLVIMLRFIDLRRPRDARRSNVGLIFMCARKISLVTYRIQHSCIHVRFNLYVL